MTTATAYKPEYCKPCYVKTGRRTTLWLNLLDGTCHLVFDDRPHRVEVNVPERVMIVTCHECETVYNIPMG